MKILIFTEGTVLMHVSEKGLSREEIVLQRKEFAGIDHLPDNLSSLLYF